MKTLSRWSLAVLLIPCVWAVIRELVQMTPLVAQEGFSSWWRYLLGAVSYLVFEQLLRKPMWLYVVGHELTHAISGILSGAQVHSFKATSKGGQVKLSKSNAFIALSPYIIPFYLFLLVGIYSLLHLYVPNKEITWIFEFLLGAALMFHLSLTFAAFHSHQSDLKVLGFFLSGVLILLGNGLILVILGVTLFTTTPPIKTVSWNIAKETSRIWMVGLKSMGTQIKKQFDNSELKSKWIP